MTGLKPKIAIVASQYNKYIVERLLDGCLNKLTEHGIDRKDVSVVEVPGAFEIPVAVKQLLESRKLDAVITLGAVIKGETPHFEVIVNSCSMEISRISVDKVVPVIFGVLTVNTVEQAMDRSGDEESNKGSEAAIAAIDMVNVMQSIKAG